MFSIEIKQILLNKIAKKKRKKINSNEFKYFKIVWLVLVRERFPSKISDFSKLKKKKLEFVGKS